MATKPFLVVTFGRETPFFGDETISRRHFWTGNSIFWRRDHFSSSFLCGKVHFLVTKPFLVVTFVRETPFFGDETTSRRHFEPGNATFRRRDHFSSSLLREKSHFLATRSLLVVIFSREMPLFGDEITSRRHFCAKNSTFWRRDPFSSSLLYGKLHFLATKPFLVVTFMRESPFFGDEITSRRHFEPRNATFRRRDHFSSSFLYGKLLFLATRLFLVVIFMRESPFFGDETTSRRHFWTGKSIFWRRDHFSSSFLHEKLNFLATRPFLVVIFAQKTPFFGDETLSRRHFCAKNSIFWRRNPFSSSFLCGKVHFLVTRSLLVVIFVRETPFFGDETLSRRHFCAKNSTFW
ncbi:hypothetical protein NSS89_16270 [Caldifermentibacillus hisashii]|uniref:hypothetical protein n=1 Tax=Caldifermentibacillus hisashii TaxID=996558 RepID=UPI0031FD5FB4